MAGDAETPAQDAGTATQDAPMSDAELAAALSDDATDGSEGQTGDGQVSDAATGEATETQTEPMIDIGGEKVPLKDVQAWKESHGKVTQEFQNLAKVRKDLDPFLNVWNSLKANKPLAQAVMGLMERGADAKTLATVQAVLAGKDPATALQKPANPLEAKLMSMEERLAAYEAKEAQREADAALASEFAGLRESAPELKGLSKPEWDVVQAKVRDFLIEKGKEGKWNIPVDVAYAYLSKNNAVAFALQKGQEDATARAARDRKAPPPKVKGGGASGAPKGKPVHELAGKELDEYLTSIINKD